MDCCIVRRVDENGKIALPEDILKTLKINTGSKLDIGLTPENKIILTKHSDIMALSDYSDLVVNAISLCVEHDILICDTDQVLSSNKKKYLSKPLNEQVQDLIYKKEIVVKKQIEGSEMLKFFENDTTDYCCQLIVPIVDENAIGAIIVLASNDKCFDDSTIKICKTFAEYLKSQL